MSADLKRRIEATVQDLVSNLVYYDRKEDEELPRGAIERAVADGVVTKAEIVKLFSDALDEALGEDESVTNLAAAVAEVRRDHPLKRCAHGSALRDHGGFYLEPACGCRDFSPDKP